jgi:hypothetical protein
MVVEAILSMLLEVMAQVGVVCTLLLHLEVMAQEREVTELLLAAMEVDTRVQRLVLHNIADRGATVKAIDLGTDHFLGPTHG